MDTGGYLNMCGHGAIAVVTAVLEAGIVEARAGGNEVVLEAPVGLIRATAAVRGGAVESVSFENVPSFVYRDDVAVQVEGRTVPLTIAFGGSFFALAGRRRPGPRRHRPRDGSRLRTPRHARARRGEPHGGREPSDARYRHGGPRGVLGVKGAQGNRCPGGAAPCGGVRRRPGGPLAVRHGPEAPSSPRSTVQARSPWGSRWSARA